MDHLRDLPIVLQDFRTQVQSLAAHLEIESIEAESAMAGQPDVTKMAIAMAVEELSAHYKSLPNNKKAEIEKVIAELESRFGHHPRIAEIIQHLRDECQSAR
jgi:hypothetical protein